MTNPPSQLSSLAAARRSTDQGGGKRLLRGQDRAPQERAGSYAKVVKRLRPEER